MQLKIVVEELVVLFSSEAFKEVFEIPKWYVFKETSFSDNFDIVVLFEDESGTVGEITKSVYLRPEDVDSFDARKIMKNQISRISKENKDIFDLWDSIDKIA